MASFKQRTFQAADYRYKAAIARKDSALHELYATLETGRDEEIRVAHNEAVDRFEMMLFSLEEREKALLHLHDVDPRKRHIP